jgi:hypothetical protein
VSSVLNTSHCPVLSRRHTRRVKVQLGDQPGTAQQVDNSPRPLPSAPFVERRSGMDRRKVNLGPPAGMRERRVNLEPRKPEVQEISLSASDWVRFDEVAPLPPRPSKDAASN